MAKILNQMINEYGDEEEIGKVLEEAGLFEKEGDLE